jgi:DNA-binding transcriptional MerR regulator
MTVPAPVVYRMKDLCELTGLSRQAIHFYIQQGLLPEGVKTGRNMAYYGPEHVERLKLVRQLQEERFLPLKAIRALLAGETAGMAPSQRNLLAEVATRLGASLGAQSKPAMVDAAEACARYGVTPAELARLVEIGLVAARGDQISAESVWLLDVFGQMRAAGFTAELGFGPDDFLIYDEVVTALFQRETAMLVDRMTGLPPERSAEMIEKVLPLIHAVVIHLHTAAVKNFFAALEPRP